jgi:UDP-N-acetylglucosamine acyltransferase
MAEIHPTAIVDNAADIAGDAGIGPYCIVGPHVSIGSGCRLVGHVHLTGDVAIGARTVIYPFASLGTPPQSVKYRGGRTQLVVGADCDIREGVTINTGTEDGGGVTRIGDRCFMMVNSHVGHDCQVGNGVTFANNAVLGGHVVVGDNVVIGGQAAVHQFVRIGEGAMIAGVSGVAADIIPFGFAIGQRAVLGGLNVVGIRRRGLAGSDLRRIRTAYRRLFLDDGAFRDRLAAVEREFCDDVLVSAIVAFIREGQARPLMHPATSRQEGGAAAEDPAP